MNILFPVWK